jgi:thiol-disulfide isomerase/thioredoxin
MKPGILFHGIAHFFILLFAYTALSKVMDISDLRQELTSSPFLGSMAGFVTIALPLMEVILVVLLFNPTWRLKGLYGSLGLMVLFTLYLLGIYYIDDHISCSCGGIVEHLSPKQHLLFNTICIALAWIGIRAGKHLERSQSKKTFFFNTSITLSLFGTVIWMTLTAATDPSIPKTGLEGKPIPNLTILLLDSVTNLNTKDIPAGSPFIVIGFSPYCPHCRQEIKDITSNINKFQSIHIYLISAYPLASLKTFNEHFQLNKYPNITIGIDSKNSFLSYFNTHYIPLTAVFNSKKRLGEAITGTANLAMLLNCIKN